MDADTRRALTHLQLQINFLAKTAGQAIGLLADDPRRRALVEGLLAQRAGVASTNRAWTLVMERVQAGAEETLFPNRSRRPDPDEPAPG